VCFKNLGGTRKICPAASFADNLPVEVYSLAIFVMRWSMFGGEYDSSGRERNTGKFNRVFVTMGILLPVFFETAHWGNSPVVISTDDTGQPRSPLGSKCHDLASAIDYKPRQ
jgi:hypothetical protein